MAHTWVEGEIMHAASLNQYFSDLDELVDRAEDARDHAPIIQSGTWWVWNATLQTPAYEDTGVEASAAVADSMPYVTTAPTANNPTGLKIAVLSAEPVTKYSGWLYIIL